MYSEVASGGSSGDEEEYYQEDEDEEDEGEEAGGGGSASAAAALAAADAKATKLTKAAIALAEGGDLLGAMEAFAEAARLFPNGANLHDNLGVTQMRLGLLDAAAASFDKAAKLSGKASGNAKALADHVAHAAKIGHDTSKMYAEVASGGSSGDEEEYYQEDEDDESEEKNKEVEAKVKAATDAAIKLAEAGEVVGALKLFQKAASLNPASGTQQENLGVTQMRLGLLDAAAKSLSKAKALMASSGESDSLGKNLEALADHVAYGESIGHDTKTMYAEFAGSGDGNDDDDENEDEDEDDEDSDDAYASEADPDEADRMTQRAIKLAEAGDTEGSLEFFQAAVDANPKNGRMWENLGVTQVIEQSTHASSHVNNAAVV
jgi:tetratricopeptide (TPR) repeat protein